MRPGVRGTARAPSDRQPETEAIDASASPRKPSVATRSRSAASRSCSSRGARAPGAACRARCRHRRRSRGRASCRPASSATLSAWAPASRLFSRSSFTTEAGRLDHLAGGDLADERIGQQPDRGHGCSTTAPTAPPVMRMSPSGVEGGKPCVRMNGRRPDLREPEEGAIDEPGGRASRGRRARPRRSRSRYGGADESRVAFLTGSPASAASRAKIDLLRARRHDEQRGPPLGPGSERRASPRSGHLAAEILGGGPRGARAAAPGAARRCASATPARDSAARTRSTAGR